MAEELAVKRLKYFNHQFLRVEDFQEEQDYHLRMRRRLNRVLHTWGVAEGLQVTAAAGASAVRVAAGTAIDEQGREIVLLTERTEPLATYSVKTVYVTLRYLEEPTDETDETGTGLEARRWTERPEVRIVDAPPARQGEVLVLARVSLAANGTVASVDEGDVANRRRYAGAVGGDLEVRSLSLAAEGRPAADYPLLRYGAMQRADLTGSLRVTRDATVDGKLAVTGTSAFTGAATFTGATFSGAAAFTGAATFSGGATLAAGRLGVGVATADAPVHLKGGGWDLVAGEGDFKVGDAAQRLKIGVALGGAGGGDARIRAHGGTNRLILGSGTADVLTVQNGRVGIGTIDPVATLHVPESGIQIGASATVANNFHFVSDEVPAGAPRALRVYGGNYGSGTHLLSVTSAGRVGIGVTTPGTPLHVRGRVVSAAAAGFPGGFSLIPTDASAWFHVDHPGGNRMRFSQGGEPGGTELMTLNASGSVGIGTASPAARLQVSGGAIMPAAGNSAAAGIQFPDNPGGGGGDAAWIRYYARAGEATTLEIGAANDADDHISLMPSGSVGVGTLAPEDRLHVHGGLRVLTDGNPIRFTSAWSGHADANKAEVSNDTAAYKTLMLLGNTSGGGGIRRVGVWDELAVHGKLIVDNDILMSPGKTFYNSGRMHISGEEHVYFLNKGMTIVSKSWGGTGNLSVEGNIGIGTESPTYRLHVMGGARIQGSLSVDGSKYGYVVDEFVNTTGDVLEQGDVVVIGPNQEAQYLNAAGRIPIPEVDLTDREHDTRVCGVVAEISSFAERNGDADPAATEVQPGQVGAMVTLGAFVVCKVDAKYGAIQVGDLLTTSATRGHARRVDDPARAAGAIVGKALASLEKGRGRIPVLVTLH
ncbi:MAG: hypothetical protein ABW277_25510 [Longimicrobiaceae bacterium]